MLKSQKTTSSLAVLSLSLLIACNSNKKEADSAPASQPASAPAASQPASPPAVPPALASPASAAPPAGVLASDQALDNSDLRGDLLQVKRVSGGALMIKFRVTNTSAQPKDIYYNAEPDDFYFTDPAENKKYGVLKGGDNKPMGDFVGNHLQSGQQQAGWAKFPAPPATSTKISIHLPRFAPFEDVPISQ